MQGIQYRVQCGAVNMVQRRRSIEFVGQAEQRLLLACSFADGSFGLSLRRNVPCDLGSTHDFPQRVPDRRDCERYFHEGAIFPSAERFEMVDPFPTTNA